MSLQRAHHSIIRSIRQQSLVKDWFRNCNEGLPHFSDFSPDSRSQDSDDILVGRLGDSGEKPALMCEMAGRHVEQANGREMAGRMLSDIFDRKFGDHAIQIWLRCLKQSVPIYSIMPTADCELCPVTIELLSLPFVNQSKQPDTIVVSFHAFSSEGKFRFGNLLQQTEHQKVTLWSTIIDSSVPIPKSLEQAYELE